jgi:2-amino-4-hydroxy-6-hydroxymethyldihydropteridine diphosphokinase
MAVLYISLGSNLGNKSKNLIQAIALIEQTIGSVTARSLFYETAPWGFKSSHSFLNACLKVETELLPATVLMKLQDIEKSMGRIRITENQYVDRIIDLDILFYDDLVINSENLIIPHPLIQERAFTLVPLVEIAPTLIHPVLKRTISSLLEALNSQS